MQLNLKIWYSILHEVSREYAFNKNSRGSFLRIPTGLEQRDRNFVFIYYAFWTGNYQALG